MMSAKDYPYLGKQTKTCNYDVNKVVNSLTSGSTEVSSRINDQGYDITHSLVNHGPLSMEIIPNPDINVFRNYKSGVIP